MNTLRNSRTITRMLTTLLSIVLWICCAKGVWSDDASHGTENGNAVTAAEQLDPALQAFISQYKAATFNDTKNIVKEISAFIERNPGQLLTLLKSPDLATRIIGLRAISILGPKAAFAVDTLRDIREKDADSYNLIDNAFVDIGPACMPAVLIFLKSPQIQLQRSGANIAAQIGPAAGAAIPSLITILNTKDVTLCLLTIDALGKIGSGSQLAAAALAQQLRARDFMVQQYAVNALAKIGEVALPYLEAMLTSQNRDQRSQAICILGRIGKLDAVIRLLRLAAGDQDAQLRYEATACLAEYGSLDDELVPNLQIELRNSSPIRRSKAIAFVGNMPLIGPNGLTLLSQGLADTDRYVVRETLTVIAEKGCQTDKIITQLLNKLGMDDEDTQLLLQKSIAKIGPNAISRLKPFLSHQKAIARYNAAACCQQAGALSEPCLAELIEAANDRDYDIAETSCAALRQIGVPAVKALVAQLPLKDKQVSAVHCLSALGDVAAPAAQPLGELAANTEDVGVLTAVLEALAAIGPQAAPAIASLQHRWDRSPQPVKAQIADTLAILAPAGTPEFHQWAYNELLKSTNEVDCAARLMRCLDTQDRNSAELLRRIISGEATTDVSLRAIAIEVAARARPYLLTAELFGKLVRSEDADIAVAAIHALTLIGDDRTAYWEAADRLDVINDQHPLVRLALLQALRPADSRFSKYILALLSDTSTFVRIATLSLLTETEPELSTNILSINGPAFLSPLVIERIRAIAESDEDEVNRQLAVRVLGKYDEDRGALLQTLTKTCHDQSRLVVIESITVLEGFRDEATPLLKTLYMRVKENPDPELERYLYTKLFNSRNLPSRHLSVPFSDVGTGGHCLALFGPSDSPPSFYAFEINYYKMRWPPGRYSDRLPFIADDIGRCSTTVGAFYQRLTTALTKNHYPFPGLLAIPGGFAVTTMPERIQSTKRQFDNSERWTYGKLPLSCFSGFEYFKRLFFGQTEQFRWFVFYVTREQFDDLHCKDLDFNSALMWQRKGRHNSTIPPEIVKQKLSEYMCGVLVYEFELKNGDITVKASHNMTMTARDHLTNAGIDRSLFKQTKGGK